MLTQNGLQAWLEDQDGVEIKHENISCDRLNAISAIFPVDAEQPYTVHWSKSEGSIPGSYWNELSMFHSKIPNRYEKIATHWMGKSNRTTQSRDSRRLQGRFKGGLITPFDELSLKEQEVAEQSLRLTFRQATFYSTDPIMMDEDGYYTPEYKLSKSIYTKPYATFRFHFRRKVAANNQPTGHRAGKRGLEQVTPESSVRVSRRRKLAIGTSTFAERQYHEVAESTRTSSLSSLSSREPTPYEPRREASAAPMAASQFRVMSQKALEASEKDLSIAEMESKELHQIANLVSRVKNKKMDVQRVKAENKGQRARLLKGLEEIGIDTSKCAANLIEKI